MASPDKLYEANAEDIAYFEGESREKVRPSDLQQWASKARNVAQQIVDNVPAEAQAKMTAQQAAFQLRVIRDMAERLLATFPPK